MISESHSRRHVAVALCALALCACTSDDSDDGAAGAAGFAGGAGSFAGAGGAPAGSGGAGSGGAGSGGAGSGAGSGGAGSGAGSGGAGSGAGSGGAGSGGAGSGGSGSAAMARATIAGFEAGMVTGTVTFAQAGTSVTVTVMLSNCPDGEHPVHIHQGTSCENATTQGAHWDMTRGEGIPNVTCTGNTGMAMHTRTNMPEMNAWSIGGNATTNVVGHAFVVHNMGDPAPRIGCGVIMMQ